MDGMLGISIMRFGVEDGLNRVRTVMRDRETPTLIMESVEEYSGVRFLGVAKVAADNVVSVL
jgi:hypothetical protein